MSAGQADRCTRGRARKYLIAKSLYFGSNPTIFFTASVSEHQPTTWFSFFFDLHILACVFPVGLWYCIKNVNDERVFIILYAVSAVYFAGVMVRLMLTLTPCVCVLSAIAFSTLFERYLKEDEMGNDSNGTAGGKNQTLIQGVQH